MRVLLLTSSFYPVLGGLQTVIRALAMHLAGRVRHLEIVTNRYPRSLPANDVLEGIRIRRLLFLSPHRHHIMNGRIDLFAASLCCYPINLLRLRLMVRRFQPDVINVHYPDSQLPFMLPILRGRKYRLVVSLHGFEIEQWFEEEGPASRSDSQSNALRRLLCEADAVTACSANLLELAIKHEPSVKLKGHAIYNGIELERFNNRSKNAALGTYVLAYGRLNPQKGFDLLLQAWAKVVDSVPGVRLIIAGEGDEAATLEALSRELGLEKSVLYFGRATSEQVVQLINGSLFVIVPSRREPFGIVALEAMAAGKAVLATRVGGLPEFVPDPPNLLVPPTVPGLATAMLEWLRRLDMLESIGKTNRSVAESFTWASTAQQYSRLYEST